MALRKIKIGMLIKQRREKYSGHEMLPIRGVSREGFIPPKQDGADTSIYNVFYKDDFVFNPARMELNSIALNTAIEKGICSSLYEIFYITRKDLVLPQYLNLYIKRNEFARNCWFNAIGSARNYFRIPDLSEFEIELPDIPTQQKYVDIYLSMIENQKAYERGLEDLKLVCDAYIEDLRRKMPCKEIGGYIECTDRKTDNPKLRIQGISNQQKLVDSNSRVDGVDTEKYLRIDSREFGYSPIHINDGSIAFNATKDSFLLSPIYKTFKVANESKLLPEYLMMWFGRNEFIRYCTFHAFGSARDTFEWEQMCKVKIPIPSIEVQQAIVNIYKCYTDRKEINEKLKQQIKDVCPILIKGAIEEGK